MDNPEFTLDDLHDDDNPDVIKDPMATPSEEVEDGLTPTDPPAAKPDEVIADPPAPDPSKDPSADPALTDPVSEEPSAASGLELFLSQYDIEGGVITYDDGTTAHISELSAEEQATILSSVASDARPSVEDQYDLDQKEIDLLNELRTSNKSVEEYVNDLAQDRFSSFRADSESREVNYKDMADDAVYIKFLREKDSDITEAQVEEGLAIAKDNPTFKTLVGGLRDNFIFAQDKAIEANNAVQTTKATTELETDRQSIVDAASTINEVGGFEIPREVKNDVLHDLLEVNEHGDSLFLENTFSDPKTMFKTAWFSKYGEAYLSDIEKYYKQEVTKAFKRGQTTITDGLPSEPRSLNGSPAGKALPRNEDGVYDPDAAPSMDLEDLHE